MLMEDVAVVVVQTTPGIVLIAIRGISIFLFSLAVVYILGRMLELLRDYRTKNFIALICMVGSSYFTVWLYDQPILQHPLEFYARAAMYLAVAAITYVLVGFDLYERFNAWSDSKFGKADRKLPTKRGPKK